MIGQKIIHHESLDSTNNFAAKLLSEGTLTHGTVILADEQTAGKGQRGSNWYTEPRKNLIMSIYVEYANLSVFNQESINHIVSLSLIKCLNDFGINSAIKWPNDILVDSHKIAGILIENQLERSFIKSSIIGIGLNINQTDFKDLKATSILNLTRRNMQIYDVLNLFLIYLNEYFKDIEKGKFIDLKQHYLKHLWLLNTSTLIEDSSGIFTGKIIGTSEKGLLLIEKEHGQISEYDLKEVSFVERRN